MYHLDFSCFFSVDILLFLLSVGGSNLHKLPSSSGVFLYSRRKMPVVKTTPFCEKDFVLQNLIGSTKWRYFKYFIALLHFNESWMGMERSTFFYTLSECKKWGAFCSLVFVPNFTKCFCIAEVKSVDYRISLAIMKANYYTYKREKNSQARVRPRTGKVPEVSSHGQFKS